MKKTLMMTIFLSLLVLSCHLFEDNDPVNGTWALSTISGVPVPAGISSNMTISGSSNVSYTFTAPGPGTLSATGTVAFKNEKTYTITFTGAVPVDFTLSANDTVFTSSTGLAYTKYW